MIGGQSAMRANRRSYAVHNPLYTRELIYDSFKAIIGSAPTSLPTDHDQTDCLEDPPP